MLFSVRRRTRYREAGQVRVTLFALSRVLLRVRRSIVSQPWAGGSALLTVTVVDDESPGFSPGTFQLLMGFADGESPRFTLCMSESAQSMLRLLDLISH
jgi:hypothetical protein